MILMKDIQSSHVEVQAGERPHHSHRDSGHAGKNEFDMTDLLGPAPFGSQFHPVVWPVRCTVLTQRLSPYQLRPLSPRS